MTRSMNALKQWMIRGSGLALATLCLEAAAVPTSVDVSIPVKSHSDGIASAYTQALKTNKTGSSWVRAGRFLGDVKSGPAGDVFLGPDSAAFGGSDFWAWCIDASQVVADHMGGMQVSGAVPDAIAKVAGLFDYRAGQFAAGNAFGLDIASQRDRTAFQAVLWELVHETSGGYDITSGTFKVTSWLHSSITGTAASILDALQKNELVADSGVRLFALRSDKYQDQLVATVVPVPGAVWLFGSALLVLAGFNSRKPRRASV